MELPRAILSTIALGVLLAGCVRAEPLPFDPTPLHDVVQDGAGRVWAIGRESGLIYWNDGKWQPKEVPLPGVAPAGSVDPDTVPRPFPLVLQTNRQGVVHVLWGRSDLYDAGEVQYWMSRIGDTEPPLSTAFRAQLASASIAFGSDGIGWLTEPGPRIYRIGSDLKIELAHTLNSNQMAGTRFDQYNPVQAVPDTGGGVLLYGEQRFRELATLRGFLVASATGIAASPKIEGLPDRGFSIVAPVDSGRLWAAVPDYDEAPGLYEVDLKTLRATKLAEPAPHAFDHLSGIHVVGSDRYVFSDVGGYGAPLWRWRAGTWERVLSSLDTASFQDFYRIARPFQAVPDGVWMGTGGQGLLFVPSARGSTAELFDWRQGQPLESVHRIVPLANGRLLLAGFGQGTTHLHPADLRKGRSISRRLIDVWQGALNLQVDSNGRLWTLFAGSELAAWNGEAWTRYPLPKHVREGEHKNAVGLDTLGRFWIAYTERQWIPEQQELRLTEGLEIFSPAQSRWQHFDSLESAFSDLVHADIRARVDLPGEREPEISARGEICFLGYDWSRRQKLIHFFDGQAWRRWDLASVGFPYSAYTGQPFFTEAGELAINFSDMRNTRNNQTALLDGQRWMAVPFRSAGRRDPPNLRRARHWLPGEPALPLAGDSAGGAWKVESQQLFRSDSGISVPQFDLADVHPFIGARRVNQVWVDAKGNLVLLATLPFGNLSCPGQYVVMAPKAPASKAHMEMVKVDHGGVELRLRPAGQPGGATDSLAPASAGEGFTAVEVYDDHMILRWAGTGVLEAADQVEGPWRQITGAASPHAVEMTKPSEFYRVRR